MALQIVCDVCGQPATMRIDTRIECNPVASNIIAMPIGQTFAMPLLLRPDFCDAHFATSVWAQFFTVTKASGT